MREKIVLLGSTGIVGRAMREALPTSSIILAPTCRELDLTDLEAVDNYFKQHKPTLIINAAGLARVHACEHNKALADTLNTGLPARLAQLSTRLDALLVHFSCVDVYGDVLPRHGLTLCCEQTATNPRTHYARSKLAGDWAIQAQAKNYLIFRLSGVYCNTDLTIKSERDALSLGAPTSVDYVATTIVRSLQRIYRRVIRFHPGVYNFTAKGHADWNDFYRELSVLRKNYRLLNSSPRLVEQGSRISVEKLENAFCIQVPTWQSQLKSVMHTPEQLNRA